jgi:CheY-like chemotaxis protein
MHTTEQIHDTILIVDDDPGIREALTMILEDDGYRVVSATNGRSALDLLQQSEQLPQLILLDLMMPVMNGWELHAALREDTSLAAIPVIMLSADSTVNLKARVQGAAGYLAKPVDLSVLLDTVSQHCRTAE